MNKQKGFIYIRPGDVALLLAVFAVCAIAGWELIGFLWGLARPILKGLL